MDQGSLCGRHVEGVTRRRWHWEPYRHAGSGTASDAAATPEGEPQRSCPCRRSMSGGARLGAAEGDGPERVLLGGAALRPRGVQRPDASLAEMEDHLYRLQRVRPGPHHADFVG